MERLITSSKTSAAITQKRAQIGQARISYSVAGCGAPLILIHGLSGSWRWWERNIPALAGHFRVYAIDLIGFGASRGKQRFVLSEAAGYLARWMNQLGIERASLVGHSMGGFIAADLAAEHPERVDKLALVDAAALPFEQDYVHHILGLLKQLRRLPLSFLPLLFADALRAGPLTILGAAHELISTNMRPKLEHIQAPTLVIWGEHDTLVPLELGKRLCRQLSNEELVVIEHASHNPMWDQPAAFNRVLLDFLTKPGHDGQRCKREARHVTPSLP